MFVFVLAIEQVDMHFERTLSLTHTLYIHVFTFVYGIDDGAFHRRTTSFKTDVGDFGSCRIVLITKIVIIQYENRQTTNILESSGRSTWIIDTTVRRIKKGRKDIM